MVSYVEEQTAQRFDEILTANLDGIIETEMMLAGLMPGEETQKLLRGVRTFFANQSWQDYRVKRADANEIIDRHLKARYPWYIAADESQREAGGGGNLLEQCRLADIARVVVLRACPKALAVLVCLELFAKVKDGYEVTVSESTLTEWTGLKRRAIQLRLKSLMRHGVVLRISGGGKEGVTSRYRLYGPRMMETARTIIIPDKLFGSKKWKTIVAAAA